MKGFTGGVISTLLLIIVLLIFWGGKNPKSINNAKAAPISSTQSTLKPTPNQNIHSVPLPSYITFAGEEVPLHKYHVKERLDREIMVNTYWHSNTLRILKLSERYFSIIEPILAKNGIPDDMKFIVMTESGLQENAASGAGAKGLWQFLKGTATQYGLEVSNEVDERYHIEKATEAACKYFKKAHEKFGSWALTAAAYNAGSSRINSLLGKQKVQNYFDLYLVSETDRYVFRILAFKELYNNPEKYGFYLNSSDRYPSQEYTTTKVKSISDIPTFALNNGTSYRELKLLNQWLRSTKLSPRKSGKEYTIKIPN